jgi:hypothetical protein
VQDTGTCSPWGSNAHPRVSVASALWPSARPRGELNRTEMWARPTMGLSSPFSDPRLFCVRSPRRRAQAQDLTFRVNVALPCAPVVSVVVTVTLLLPAVFGLPVMIPLVLILRLFGRPVAVNASVRERLVICAEVIQVLIRRIPLFG